MPQMRLANLAMATRSSQSTSAHLKTASRFPQVALDLLAPAPPTFPTARHPTHGVLPSSASKFTNSLGVFSEQPLGEVLPVLGTIGLLGLWAFQQTGIEERASELRRLSAARAVYQTYQSNNALFNAIIEGTVTKAADQIRTLQIYNYELGLRGIEEALPSFEKTDIPAGQLAYDSSLDIDAKIRLTQKRLEKLQDKLAKREAAISLEAQAAKKLYLWLYLGLSLMMIMGAVIKAVDKLFIVSS